MTEDKGKIILGQLIFATRFALAIRLLEENLIEDTNKLQGSALTVTEKIASVLSGLLLSIAKAYLTKIPAATIKIGMKIAHIKPITDCLYFIIISRHVIV